VFSVTAEVLDGWNRVSYGLGHISGLIAPIWVRVASPQIDCSDASELRLGEASIPE